MSSYNVGDTIRAWVTFKAASFTVEQGVPSVSYSLADPDTVTLTVKPRDEDPAYYTWPGGDVVRESLGVFYCDFPIAVSGHHVLHWAGTGAAAVTSEKEFVVSVPRI
jgi:hypothetical protein